MGFGRAPGRSVEPGKRQLGKIILAACFINDLGTAAGAGGRVPRATTFGCSCSAAVTAVVLVVLFSRYAPWMFRNLGRAGKRAANEVRLAHPAGAWRNGVGGGERSGLARLSRRHGPRANISWPNANCRIACGSSRSRSRTPFYFLKAGSLVEARAVAASIGLIAVFLAIKMATKFIGILPLTVYHEFDRREGMYTTLLMSTGLTFGSISALFGLTNKIIDQTQYTISSQPSSPAPSCRPGIRLRLGSSPNSRRSPTNREPAGSRGQGTREAVIASSCLRPSVAGGPRPPRW